MIVTGSPVTAFNDAFKAALVADATLTGLVSGVYGQLSQAARTAYPYLVLGRTSRTNEAGVQQAPGSMVTLQLDGWSDAKGPYTIERILSRVVFLMERRLVFTVTGFDVVERSLTCEYEDIFDEPDENKPDTRLWHGVQRWTCEVHEVVV